MNSSTLLVKQMLDGTLRFITYSKGTNNVRARKCQVNATLRCECKNLLKRNISFLLNIERNTFS